MSKKNQLFSAICIQESWLSEDNDTSQIQLEGYNCILQGSSCSSKRGLIIYLHEKVEDVHRLNLNKYATWEGQVIEVKKAHILAKLGTYTNHPMKMWSPNGELIVSKTGVLNRYRSDFEGLFSEIGDNQIDTVHLNNVKASLQQDIWPENVTDSSPLNLDISLDEIEKAISRVKLHKTAGIESIHAEVLKSPTCIVLLHKIINYCFISGTIPTSWRRGIINPIPKCSSKDNRMLLNCRGITLITVPCKIYYDILNHRLNKWLEENKVITDEQNRYRKDRSCEDHLYSLYSIINNMNLSRQSTFVCYVDALKAFDNVNRDCLWFKLKIIEVRE